MVFVLPMLMIEGGTANAIFFRCFVSKEMDGTKLKRRFDVVFPRWSLTMIYVMLVFLTAYISTAMEQLSLFHQRMKTYDYILAMGGRRRISLQKWTLLMS